MPRKTKDEEVKKVTKRSKKADVIEVGEKSTSIKNTQKAPKLSTSNTEKKSKTSTAKASSSKSTSKKSTPSKKTTTSKETATKSSITLKASTKKTTEKKSTTKSTGTTKKSTTRKKEATNKTIAKKAETTKKSTTKKKAPAKKTTTKRTSNRKSKPVSTAEYYDLPTAYNRTIVKILAQTPSSLFVYWEISEDDKIKLQEQYGEAFFQNTRPYLIITNETMNYSFETEINDYANSWYIHIHDSSCKYGVQLIRKPIQHDISSSNSIINIISSNEIATPNDHILFDKLGKTVFFRDVKSHCEVEKDISSLSFISNIGRVYNIYDIYKEIYKNELNGDELGMGLSSSGFSSTFK